MAIGVETPRSAYTGNGSTTVFPLGFTYDSPDHVKVHVDNTLIESGITVNAEDVTFDTAPANDASIVITRETPLDQPAPLDDPQKATLDDLEAILDRGVRIMQELAQVQYQAAGYTQEETDNLLQAIRNRLTQNESDIQENQGDIDDLENAPSDSNLIVVDTENDRINTTLNTGKVLFQRSNRGLYDVQTIVAAIGSWNRNTSKDLNSFTYQGWFSADETRLFTRNGDNTGVDEYVVDTPGQPESGITAASGSNSLPGTQCIELTPDGTKALVVHFGDRDAIRIYDLTVAQSLNGGMTLSSTWQADTPLGATDSIYSLRFKPGDATKLLITRRDDSSTIHVEELQLSTAGDLTSFDSVLSYEIGSYSGYPAVGAEYLSDKQVLFLQSNHLMKRLDISDGLDNAEELESLTFSTDPQSYAPSHVGSLQMLSTGVLYIGSDSSSFNKLYAYDAIASAAWTFIDFIEDATKTWRLGTSVLIDDTVNSDTYNLSTLDQWSDNDEGVTSANYAVVVATAKFGSDRLNGGTNGTEYGIKITAGGVLVADASYIKGTDTGDADDSGVLISPGVPIEVPITNGTIPYAITRTVHGIGSTPIEDVHELRLVGFKRVLEI